MLLECSCLITCFCVMVHHVFVTNLWVWSFCFCPTRGCWKVLVAFIGTGISYVSATCVVSQAIPAIVHVYVHVAHRVLSRYLFLSIFDQAAVLVFLALYNQRLLACFYGLYRDTHFICFGDMCSLPNHRCHSQFIYTFML